MVDPHRRTKRLREARLERVHPRELSTARLARSDGYTLSWWSGLDALRRQRVTAALSNAHVALLVDLARHADLRFDCRLSAEVAQVYKPAPEVYQTAARLLGVEPAALMLVAAHPLDLRGARAAGLQTAFVDRPLEYGLGSAARDDPEADQSVGDLHELAERLAGGTYGAVSRPPGSRS